MLLTHRDDIADHAKFHAAFGCERVIHEKEASRNTRDIELQLDIRESAPLDDDFLAIPVPGHTAGPAYVSQCARKVDRFQRKTDLPSFFC